MYSSGCLTNSINVEQWLPEPLGHHPVPGARPTPVEHRQQGAAPLVLQWRCGVALDVQCSKGGRVQAHVLAQVVASATELMVIALICAQLREGDRELMVIALICAQLREGDRELMIIALICAQLREADRE